jgi:hypothetical protein
MAASRVLSLNAPLDQTLDRDAFERLMAALTRPIEEKSP